MGLSVGSVYVDMRGVTILIVGLLCLMGVEGAKKQKVYNIKKLNVTKVDMDTIQHKLDKLREDLTLVQKCLKTSKSDPKWSSYCVGPPASFSSSANQAPSGRKIDLLPGEERSTATVAADVFSVADMYLTGYSTKCGPQTITGWSNALDIYYAAAATADSGTYVSTGSGTISAPVAGYYNICGFLRFKKGGNANDVTIYAAGAVAAGFGDSVQNDWRSTGTCFIQKLAAGNTVYMRNNAGGGSDCVEETSWRYGRLSMYLVGPE